MRVGDIGITFFLSCYTFTILTTKNTAKYAIKCSITSCFDVPAFISHTSRHLLSTYSVNVGLGIFKAWIEPYRGVRYIR